MKLSSGTGKFFMLCLILGIISLFGSMMVLGVDGSPYRHGRPGGQWFLVQLAGGVMLLFSGIFGLLVNNVAETSSVPFKVKVVWVSFMAIGTSFLYCIFLFAPAV
ncbi:MAG: hypothetical protein WC444_00810 [Candidatus Paceibacterota bacterium]